jgi:hypothetical protein
VLDRDNRLVPDLTQEDFEVLDNDQVQPLVLFENETRPITVVVMLDTSFSMNGNIKLLKDAAEQFIIRLLPDDKAKVGAFNDKIEFGGHSPTIATTWWRSARARLATRRAIRRGRDEPRRLVGWKDGACWCSDRREDTSSRASFRAVMDRARNEDVMIYSIGLSSEYFDGVRVVRSKPDGALRRFAEETGGGYFELKKTTELASTFTRVAQELHSQYALAFVAPRLDNKVHKLTVRLKQPGMTARARKSYMASVDDSSDR